MDQQLYETAVLLQRDWELEIPETISEEQILTQLEYRVAKLLSGNPESFFQLMYRLDVSEKRLNETIYTADRPSSAIARLIYDRQLQKIRSRAEFGGAPGGEDDELRW